MRNNAVTLSLPEFKPAPVLPPVLTQAIQNFDGMAMFRGTLPAPTILAARNMLEALSQHHAPARSALIEVWNRKLRRGVAPIGDDDFEGRLESIMAAAGDLPGWIWNGDTLRAGLRAWRFFPTAAEVHDLLAPIAWRETRHLAVLKQIARCPLPKPDGGTVDIAKVRTRALAVFQTQRGL